jgi:hypothetical protein
MEFTLKANVTALARRVQGARYHKGRQSRRCLKPPGSVFVVGALGGEVNGTEGGSGIKECRREHDTTGSGRQQPLDPGWREKCPDKHQERKGEEGETEIRNDLCADTNNDVRLGRTELVRKERQATGQSCDHRREYSQEDAVSGTPAEIHGDSQRRFSRAG